MATIKQTELLVREKSTAKTAMHWIGGHWLNSGEHRESINPATSESMGSYATAAARKRRWP